MLSIVFAISMALWNSAPLPDNAKHLWTKAYYTWRIVGVKPLPGENLRSQSERRADLGKSFRNFALVCIPLAQEQIDSCKKHIKDNENSVVPEVQASVKLSRKHLADKEKDLKWYRQFLEVSNEGPIHFPER